MLSFCSPVAARAVIVALAFVGGSIAPVAAQSTATSAPTEGRNLVVDHLVPHRATYTMRLGTTAAGSGVVNARGEMDYSFGETCDGWTVENTTRLTLFYVDGPPMDSEWRYATWESKDGLRYNFTAETRRNGRVTETIDGTAELQAVGGPGAVRFSEPEEQSMDLPAGTWFPNAHFIEMMARARNNDPQFLGLLFDGSDIGEIYEVSALIGPPLPAPAPAADLGEGAALLDSPSRRYMIAFYDHADPNESLPLYEIHLEYHRNGVGRRILQDFIDFTLEVSLDSLESLPAPDC